MGSRNMVTLEIQGGWILFAHPTKRITPNKMKRVHETKCFIQPLYIPSSIIERRVLPRLLRPDQLGPLMSGLDFITGKEMFYARACVPEDRYGNLRLPSIPNQEDHRFYPWANWSSGTGCSPLVGVSTEPRALPVGLHLERFPI
jgi:hypothetical protein